jgi:hypothetical protein
VLLCFLFLSLFCILLLTATLSRLTIGWSELSFPQRFLALGTKGIVAWAATRDSPRGRQSSSVALLIRVLFSWMDRLLLLARVPTILCTCVRAGLPFMSRRRDSGGSAFPKMSASPAFVCEAFTVCVVLDRDLTGLEDWKLYPRWLIRGPRGPIHCTRSRFGSCTSSSKLLKFRFCLTLSEPVGLINVFHVRHTHS